MVKKATFLSGYLAACWGTSSRTNCWAPEVPASPVGSGHVHELNAQSLGVGLEDVVAAHDGLHGHVAREGIVHEHVDAPLGALFHDGVALAGLVGVHDDVSRIGDNGGVFLRGAGDEEDVVAAHLTDLLNAGGCTGHGLAHHDGLHVGVRGESNQLGDGGFRLGHEVIGVRIGDDVLGAILFQRLFGGAEFFLALRGRAGQDRDLPGSFGHSARGQRQTQHCGQRQAKQFLHSVYPPSNFSIRDTSSVRSAKQLKRFVIFENDCFS